MTAHRDLKNRIRIRQAKTGESYVTARSQVLAHRRAAPSPQEGPLEALVLKSGGTNARVRFFHEERPVTLRLTGHEAMRCAPGACIEVEVKRRWTNAGHPYASARLLRTWVDARALQLPPLDLRDCGKIALREQLTPSKEDPDHARWLRRTDRARNAHAFDDRSLGCHILEEDPHGDRLSVMQELSTWNPTKARKDLMEFLLIEPRCIEAHNLLGLLDFEFTPAIAQVHYEVAVAIAELSLPEDFDGYLLWGDIENRPYLRALHGLSLCHWRQDRFAEAVQLVEKGLDLNPPDQLGLRFFLDPLASRKPWPPDDPEGPSSSPRK